MGRITMYSTQSPHRKVSDNVKWMLNVLTIKRLPFMEVDLSTMTEQLEVLKKLVNNTDSRFNPQLPQLWFNETCICAGEECQQVLDDLQNSKKFDKMAQAALKAADPTNIPFIGIWHGGEGKKPRMVWKELNALDEESEEEEEYEEEEEGEEEEEEEEEEAEEGEEGEEYEYEYEYEEEEEAPPKKEPRVLTPVEAEETGLFVDYLNHILGNDQTLKTLGKVPLKNDTESLFDNTEDGILYCKLINHAVPDTIDERVVHAKKKLTLAEQFENLSLLINSAKAIGCNVFGIKKDDIAAGKPATTLNLLWQIIRLGLLARIDIKYHPELVRLKNPSEDMENFLTLNQDQLLVRWVNHHLQNAQEKKLKPRFIDNFGADLKDSVVYTMLLNQLDGAQCSLTPLDEPDLNKRAEMVVENAKKIGCGYLINPSLIAKGSPKMNIGFMAVLFEHKVELAPLSAEEAATLNTALFDSEGTRESRAFCLWINSLGVEPFVTNLGVDLRSGLVLLNVIDKISPGLFDWKKVNTKDPNKFKQVENCNLVVELGKKLNFSLVGIGGTDIANGNLNLTLGLVWQLMRLHVVSILKGLSTTKGKEITEAEIVAWANSNVRGAGKTSKMESFRDPSLKNGKFIVDLLYSISPRSVDYNLLTTTDTPEDNLLNAKYAISIARKLGATIFVLPEDIVEVRPKMLLTFFGSVMAVALGTTEQNTTPSDAAKGKK